jgi:transposase
MQKELYLGIDVSKGYADFVVLNSKGETVIKYFQLYDMFEGHNELYKILKDIVSSYRPEKIYAGVESTGGYENNWLKTLKGFVTEFPLYVARLNPASVNYNQKADLKRTTTDKVSARSIAEFMIRHPEKVSYNEVEYNKELKNYLIFLRMLIKQKTQNLNLLEGYIYQAFPELINYCKDFMPEWVLHLLSKYPTAKCLSKARVSSIAKIRFISEEKAEILKEKAKHSVCSAVDESMEIIIKSLSQEILSKKEEMKHHQKNLYKMADIPGINLLITIPGIAEWTALGLMVEIGTVHRFPTVKQLASFFGLHPVYKQSGDYKGKIRMSKQGSKLARMLLYNACMSATHHNEVIKKVYHKCKIRGMGYKQAMGVCMHKMLRIIYGVLKNQTEFNAKTDEANQNKEYSPKKKTESSESKKYVEVGKDAPMSGRQHRKRKVEIQHQNESVIKHGVKKTTSYKDNKLENVKQIK